MPGCVGQLARRRLGHSSRLLQTFDQHGSFGAVWCGSIDAHGIVFSLPQVQAHRALVMHFAVRWLAQPQGAGVALVLHFVKDSVFWEQSAWQNGCATAYSPFHSLLAAIVPGYK